MIKFVELLASESETTIKKLALYIYKSFEEIIKLHYFKKALTFSHIGKIEGMHVLPRVSER